MKGEGGERSVAVTDQHDTDPCLVTETVIGVGVFVWSSVITKFISIPHIEFAMCSKDV
jgi:hypothetical protein